VKVLGVVLRITLTWVLSKLCMVVWSELIWLKRGPDDGLL
jgi:hypothetical protein